MAAFRTSSRSRPAGITGSAAPVSSDPFLGGGQSLGADFSTSQALSEFKSNGYRGAGRFECKAVITSAIGSTGGALGGMVAPDRAGVVPIARRPLTVRQLCQQGRTESNVITVMRQATRNNGAAVVPEGQLKPESGLTFTEASFRCATLATHVTITRQALDDSAGLRALIDGELRGNLAEIEELQMLLGNGMGDNFLGLVPSAQLFNAPFPVANATPFDRLLQALAQASNGNYKPSAIVLNTSDAFMLHSLKDTQGRYIGGGPYEGLLNLLWTIPWVGTNALPQNHFLLGDFSYAQIWDRLDAEVLISSEHQDYMVLNLYLLRAEQRTAFGVLAPAAFVTGDLVASRPNELRCGAPPAA